MEKSTIYRCVTADPLSLRFTLTQMWETADLSTPLRSGRDDKVSAIANVGFLSLISSPWVGRRPMNISVEMANLLSLVYVNDEKSLKYNNVQAATVV